MSTKNIQIVGGIIPQPNWDQTDTTKADYIKNKPFYKEIVVKEQIELPRISTIHPEMPFMLYSSKLGLELGNQYAVDVVLEDNTTNTYTLTAAEFPEEDVGLSGIICLIIDDSGETMIIDGININSSSSETFYDNSCLYSFADGISKIIVHNLNLEETTIKTIPKEFISTNSIVTKYCIQADYDNDFIPVKMTDGSAFEGFQDERDGFLYEVTNKSGAEFKISYKSSQIDKSFTHLDSNKQVNVSDLVAFKIEADGTWKMRKVTSPLGKTFSFEKPNDCNTLNFNVCVSNGDHESNTPVAFFPVVNFKFCNTNSLTDTMYQNLQYFYSNYGEEVITREVGASMPNFIESTTQGYFSYSWKSMANGTIKFLKDKILIYGQVMSVVVSPGGTTDGKYQHSPVYNFDAIVNLRDNTNGYTDLTTDCKYIYMPLYGLSGSEAIITWEE